MSERFAVGFAGVPGALAEAVDAEPVASWDEAVSVAAGRGEDVDVRHVSSLASHEVIDAVLGKPFRRVRALLRVPRAGRYRQELRNSVHDRPNHSNLCISEFG